MQTTITFSGLLSAHKQWSIDKNPAIWSAVESALLGKSVLYAIPFTFLSLTIVEIMLTSQKWKRTFFGEITFSSLRMLQMYGRGKGVGQDMRARAVLRQSNGNSNAAALVIFPSIVLLFLTSFKKEGAAWNVSPSSNYQNLRDSAASDNFTGMKEEMEENIVRLLSVLHSRSLLLLQGLTSLHGRKEMFVGNAKLRL